MTTGFELLGLEHGVIPSDMWAVGALQSAPNSMKLDLPVLLQHCEDRACGKTDIHSGGLCISQLISRVAMSLIAESLQVTLSVSPAGLGWHGWQVMVGLWH